MKKLSSLIILGALLLPSFASAQSTTELQALIQSLLAQLQALQAQQGTGVSTGGASSGTPTPVTVTARELKVRTSPSTSASRVLSAYNGERVSVVERVTGESVEGNNVWYRTRSGYYVWSGGSTAPVFVANTNTNQNTQTTQVFVNPVLPQTTQVQQNQTQQTTQTTPTSISCIYPAAPTGYRYEGTDTSTTCGKVLVRDTAQTTQTTQTNANNSTTPAQRDTQRKSDLAAVQNALEAYGTAHGSYPKNSGNYYFSVWNSHWGGGSDDTLYNALVGGGYLAALPSDPVNKEDFATGMAGGYLADGASKDLAYVYYSPDGRQYVLGANLETGSQTTTPFGNFQLKGNVFATTPVPTSFGTPASRDAQRKTDLQNIAAALTAYKARNGKYPIPGNSDHTAFSTWFHYVDVPKSRPASWGGVDTAFYDALVGGGYLSSLPLDPINAETAGATTGNYLLDGAPKDFGYIYQSGDGVAYTLGTNMEVSSNANASLTMYGNYQVTPSTSNSTGSVLGASTSNMSTSDLTALIQSLLAQLQALQAQQGTGVSTGGASSGTPTPVTVTARELKVRTSPSTSASRVLSAYNGERVSVVERVTGESVEGNNVWYRTRSGYYVWSGGSTAPIFVTSVTAQTSTTQANTQVQAQQVPLAETQTTQTSITCTYPAPQTGYHYEGNDTATSCGKVLVRDTAQTAQTNQTPTARPSNLQPTSNITPSSDGKITLSWTPAIGATSYNIRLSDGTSARYDDSRFSTCSNSPIYYCENGITTTSITEVPVSTNKTYWFWVDPVYSSQHVYNPGLTYFVTGNATPSIPGGNPFQRDQQRKADIVSIANALDQYYVKYNRYPDMSPVGASDCGGWDVSSNHPTNFIPDLVSKSIISSVPSDPLASIFGGGCGGMSYRYVRYPAGSMGADSSKGAFYVLGINGYETIDSSDSSSPGFSTPGHNWETDFVWVTGKYENPSGQTSLDYNSNLASILTAFQKILETLK